MNDSGAAGAGEPDTLAVPPAIQIAAPPGVQRRRPPGQRARPAWGGNITTA